MNEKKRRRKTDKKRNTLRMETVSSNFVYASIFVSIYALCLAISNAWIVKVLYWTHTHTRIFELQCIRMWMLRKWVKERAGQRSWQREYKVNCCCFCSWHRAFFLFIHIDIVSIRYTAKVSLYMKFLSRLINRVLTALMIFRIFFCAPTIRKQPNPKRKTK